MNIYFDLDGTLFDLYGVENWLEQLRAYNPAPYLAARPMMNFSRLARYLNKTQRAGHKIHVISWTSKETDDEYHRRVAWAKYKALQQHLSSVHWNSLIFAHYDESKHFFIDDKKEVAVLFDDDEKVRRAWNEAGILTCAAPPHEKDIIEFLKELTQ